MKEYKLLPWREVCVISSRVALSRTGSNRAPDCSRRQGGPGKTRRMYEFKLFRENFH
jgi:hypothetical protein